MESLCSNEVQVELHNVWSFCTQRNRLAFETAETVKWDRLRSIAHAFAENMDDAASIRMLPMYSAMWGRKELDHLMAFLEVFLNSEKRLQWYEDAQVRAELDAQVRRTLQDKFSKDENIEAFAEWGRRAERELMSEGTGRSMLARVIFAVLTSTWTAFEVLMGDVWRLFVNSFPEVLTRPRMQQTFSEPSQGVSSRSVPLGLISRQHFDLRSCMGDLLAERINFSDLGQIKNAHADLFCDPELAAVLENPKLRLLAEARHLILHRSAAVDEKFNRSTGQSFTVGQTLPIGKLPLQEMVDAVYDCGCYLVRFVDQRQGQG